LRETALKNAEAAIVEKYSGEVRETLEQLLEQEDDLFTDAPPEEAPPAAADPAAEGEEPEELAKNIPLAATDDLAKAKGNNLASLADGGEAQEFNVNLDALQEAISNLEAELNESEDEEIDLSESDLADILSEDEEDYAMASSDDEDDDDDDDDDDVAARTPPRDKKNKADFLPKDVRDKINKKDSQNEELNLDSLVDAITEKLTVDMGAELAGWAGRSSEDQAHEMEKELAHRRSTDVAEELEDLKKAQEELVFENKQLKEQLLQYKQATNELKEGMQDVNLSNARLLYTNRVLRNTSLNERQKETIVEAISKAGSVIEARTIFDTLQSTAQAKPKKSPQSLSEAINRNRSSVIRASRYTEKPSADPFQDRMKKLAGIK
jgi:hypothetical protein